MDTGAADIAAAYRLSEDDVPGASLNGKSPDRLNVVELSDGLLAAELGGREESLSLSGGRTDGKLVLERSRLLYY